METGHDYITLLLHEERAARLHGEAAWERLVRSVAHVGKPSRGRGRRRAAPAPIIPLRPRRSAAGGRPEVEAEAPSAQADGRTAS